MAWARKAASFLQLLRASPARQLVMQAHALRDTGDAAGAAALYRQAIAMGAKGVGVRKQLANMLKDSRQFQEANYQYCRCLEIEPGNGDTFLQLGHLHKLQGDHAKAAGFYHQAAAHPATFAMARAELDAIPHARGNGPASSPHALAAAAPGDAVAALTRLVQELDARVQSLSDRVAGASPPDAEQVAMQEIRNNWYSLLPMFLNTASTIASMGASIDALAVRVQAIEERRQAHGAVARAGEASMAG